MHKFDLTEINRIGAEIKYSEKRDQKKLQITKEKILKCKQNIFIRFDKESTYRELGEDTARGIVSVALDNLINELDRKEDITDDNRSS